MNCEERPQGDRPAQPACVLRRENFPNGAGVPPNLNREIVERAYWSPDFILWAVEEMARFPGRTLTKTEQEGGTLSSW